MRGSHWRVRPLLGIEVELNELTDYGFTWGPMELTRICHVEGRGYVLEVKTDSKNLQIYVSEKGRSVRAWLDHEPLKVEA